MAIQKHNIYYDASKPESGIYYYAENGEQKELFLNNVLSGENGISAISAVDGNTWVIGITDDYKDNIEKIPGLSDNFVILSADVGNKLYISATDNWDILPYSGSTNISIHDHIIDFQNTANLIGDDAHIAVISADNNIIVSALKDFVDKEYVDEAIVSSVSGKFDSSAFNTYSGIIDNKIDKLSNDFNNKLDISATNNWDISAYIAGNHISIEDHIISIEDAKNLSGDEKNITVLETDDAFVISGLKDFVDKKYVDDAIASAAPTSAVANKLDKSVFSAYSADIALQLNNISADKLDTSAFTAYSAHALDNYYKKTETYNKQEIQNALDTKLDTTAFNDYSDNIDDQLQTLSSVKLDTSAFTTYSAEINTELNNITADVDKKLYTSATDNWDYITYSGGQNVSVVDHIIDISGTKSLSGDGKNIEVVELADTFIISATKDIVDKSYVDNNFVSKTDFGTYSGNAKNQIDSKLDISAFTAYSAHALDNYYTKDETSGKAEIQNALGTKLDTTAFNDYTATALDNYYTKDETSGKTEIQNALNTKLDTTAFNDYTATALNDIATNSGNWNASYTALTANSGNWDNTYNTVTTNSGKWENSYTALTANSALWLKEADVAGFATKTELNNASSILINQDNYLSGIIDTKLDTTAFNAYSAHALNDYYKKSETSGKTEIQNALGTKLDTTAFNNYSANVKTQIDSKLTKNDFDSYSAAVDNDIDYISAAVSSIPAQVQSNWEETNTASPAYIQNKPVDLEMSAGNGISIIEANNTLVFAVSGNYADATEVDTDINYLSGIIDTKLDTTAFNNYSANVKTQIDSKLTKNDFDSYSAIIDTDIDYLSAAINDIPAQVQSNWEETNTASPAYIQNKPVDLELSAGNGISITETNNTLVFAVSGNYADATEVNNKLTALSANKLDISATTGWDISAYSAGNNITIVDHVIDLKESKNLIGDGENIIVTESGSNIIVSALKDILDKDDFDSYSAIIDDDIDYLSAAIEDSILSVGTDLKIENGIISVNTNGIVENSADMSFVAGSATYASGIGAAAFGYASSAVNDYAFAAGYRAQAIGDGSHTEGWGTVASGHNSHAEGNYTTAAGVNSHAEGYKTSATNYAAHAEGYKTSAMGQYTHTEGQNTIANNDCAHAEGQNTSALKMMTHAEGQYTIADKNCAHAEGFYTKSSGEASHTEGQFTSATMDASHAEGGWTIANANYAHAEGYGTSALLTFSHAEGNCTIANSYAMHAGGMYNETSADALFVIGNGTADDARSDAFIIYPDGSVSAQGKISADGVELGSGDMKTSLLEFNVFNEISGYNGSAFATPAELSAGINTKIENNIIDVKNISCSAIGSGNIALGTSSIADGKNSFIYGLGGKGVAQNIASGDHSIVLGWHSKAIGRYSTVLGGNYCLASADVDPNYEPPYSGGPVAQGLGTSSLGHYTHTEGIGTIASNQASHAEGGATSSFGVVAHAEGALTLASGEGSHAEGSGTSAYGIYSHSEGQKTIAGSDYMHVAGTYNETSADALYVIGNGSAETARSDAFIITNAGLASATILATSGIPDIEAAINNIPAQVQSNWEETNTTSPAYIQNKPDDLEMSAGNGISITEVNDTLVFSVSGKLDTTAFNGYSAAVENSCVKYNDIQYAIGTANTAIASTTARYSVALGRSNSAYNSFVIGNYNKGNESHIFGNSNSGINSYILGYNCTGTESYLFGKDLSGKSWGIELGDFGDTCYPVIVGNKNATKTSAYFVVGCGNTLGNADAFIVSSNKVASAADFRAGNGVSLSSLTGLATSSWVNGQIADAITSIPAQVQSDWSATNTASPAYILNKPNQIDMQCGTYLDITSANNQITLDADISAISAALSGYANVQSDWSATNTASPAYIQNKPDVLIPVSSVSFAAPTKIMVVTAMPAAANIDPTTIYLVKENVSN